MIGYVSRRMFRGTKIPILVWCVRKYESIGMVWKENSHRISRDNYLCIMLTNFEEVVKLGHFSHQLLRNSQLSTSSNRRNCGTSITKKEIKINDNRIDIKIIIITISFTKLHNHRFLYFVSWTIFRFFKSHPHELFSVIWNCVLFFFSEFFCSRTAWNHNIYLEEKRTKISKQANQ